MSTTGEKIERFLIAHFGVKDFASVNPWNKCIKAPKLESKVEPGIMFPLNPNDTRLVSMQKILIRHLKNTSKTRFMLKLNYTHQSMVKEQAEREKLYRAGGYASGIAPVMVGFDQTVQFEAIPCGPKGIYNEAFTRTMALINSQNIENGIIRLSPQQCEEFGLPSNYVVMKDNHPEPMTADYYVMIPAKHILSWRFQCNRDFRAKYGTMAFEFYQGNTLLYYVVPNQSFEMAINTYNELFVGRTDVRPLGSIGFDTQNGSAEIIASIHYLIMPNPNEVDVASIAPILHDGFIPLHTYLEK